MAISLTHYQLLKLLKDRGELPKGGRILEIGKANWYGDADPAIIATDMEPGVREQYLVRCKDLQVTSFEICECGYDAWFGPEEVVAIDCDPPAVARGAFAEDLNTLNVATHGAFSTVINHGTAEHVFNISNVFRVMHDACEVGGLMIHESPFTGWTSHGFYNLQPTLFYDVARANGYEMVLVATEHLRSRSFREWASHDDILAAKHRDELPDHLMLFVAMRKKTDEPFKVPTQGVYCGAASQMVGAMWRELR